MSRRVLFVTLLLATSVALAGDAPRAEDDTAPGHVEAEDSSSEGDNPEGTGEAQARTTESATLISGMSILGNQEAPKSLVIVPWKSSVLGDSLGIAAMLDDSRQPVDREVFMRALSYYEIRSDGKP